MDRPSLVDLHAFTVIAAHRSFRGAADFLGVSHSSLSVAMRHLEALLGARLLNRTTRSVSLTEAGERFLQRLAPVLRSLDELLEDVGDDGNATGTLRINGNEAGIRRLLRLVPRLQTQCPALELDLVADGRLVDIVEHGFDAGVRLRETVPKDMIAIALGPDVRFLAVASPSYLASMPAVKTPDDLREHRCLRQRLASGKRYRWEFSQHGQQIHIDAPGTLTLDNNHLLVEAAVAGLGIAYVPEVFAIEPLDEGALVTVLEDWCPSIEGLCLYFPANRHLPSGLRALIALVKQDGAGGPPALIVR